MTGTDPLIVSRFDVAMEPAIEDEPILTIGAIALDGRPVALLLDPETRAKVGGWLAPTPAEAYPGELAMLRGVLGVVRAIARHGDLGETEGGRELRRIVAEHYADERAAYAGQGEKDTLTGESTPQTTSSCGVLRDRGARRLPCVETTDHTVHRDRHGYEWPTDESWLCANNPLGHRWISRPFPESTMPHCELCGTPKGGARCPVCGGSFEDCTCGGAR